MTGASHQPSFVFRLAVAGLSLLVMRSPTIAQAAAESTEPPGSAEEIPLPGDTAVPLPGESGVPLPGDVAVPLPGGQDAGGASDPTAAGGLDLSSLSSALSLLARSDLRGYVEDTFNLEYQNAAKRLVPLNALRTRWSLSGRPHPRLEFAVGLVGTLFSGKTRADLAPYLPQAVQDTLLPASPETGFPGVAGLLRFELDNRLYLHEAFAGVQLPYLRLRVGRQRFYSGTGYAYNPIDLLNEKNPLDPTYEVDGLDGILAVVELPWQTEVQGFVRAGAEFERFDVVARLSSVIFGWDVALQYTHAQRTRMNWEALNSGEGLAQLMAGADEGAFAHTFAWHLVAAEFAGEIWEIGIHAEGGYAVVDVVDNSSGEAIAGLSGLKRAARDHERFLVGLDHTFDFELYVMVEYLRLGQGRSRSSAISLNDRMAFFAGEILAINRDTLFVGASYPITDLVELAVYGIVGCNDPSAVLNPWLLIDVYPGLKLTVSGFVPLGSEGSQNGNMGSGGFARLRLSL